MYTPRAKDEGTRLQTMRILNLLINFFQSGGAALILEFFTTTACQKNFVPLIIHRAAHAVGACAVKTEVSIPAILFRKEMVKVLVPSWSEIPNTVDMSNSRLELGKLIVRLEGVDNTQGKQTLDAVKRLDDQERKTIRSIGKFKFVAQLTAETSMQNIHGLISAFERAANRPKSSNVVNQIMSFQQDQIDAWIEGFQLQLRDLHGQTIALQEDLDGCESVIRQILMVAGIAIADMEKYMDNRLSQGEAFKLLAFIFMGPNALNAHTSAVVSRAIEDFGTLVTMTIHTQRIVAELSMQLQEAVEGIQAAYRYLDRMLVIDMALEEKVSMTVEMLKGLKQEIEKGEDH